MFAVFKAVWRRRELLLMLVARNLRIRYKNSTLGFFWSLLGPLLLILIYALFLGVLRIAIDLKVLVTGIVAWQFLAMCLGDSLYAILGNANLVTKSAFPRIILPLAMVKANLVNFLLSLVVVVAYLLAVRADIGAVYWLPLIVLTQAALCLGAALILSAANVFFRDTEHILSVAMLAWFFLTPVIYTVALVLENPKFPAWVRVAFFANPMTGIVTTYRMALLSAPNPGAPLLALSYGVAWLVLCAGLLVFQKAQVHFGDEL
jgi:lipopolysaccharide transport system permease protein